MRERRGWGLNAAATCVPDWVMTASAMGLRALMVNSRIGCMKDPKALDWAMAPEVPSLAKAARARGLDSLRRHLQLYVNSLINTPRSQWANTGQHGGAPQLGCTFPTWGGVAEKTTVESWAAGEQLATCMSMAFLTHRGAVARRIGVHLTCRRPAPLLLPEISTLSQLKGGTFRLGRGMPLCLWRTRGTGAMLKFVGAARRLGGSEEGRPGLPAAIIGARIGIVATARRRKSLRGARRLAGAAMP